MAKRKPNRKNAPDRRRQSDDPLSIPDPRTMEAMLRQMVGGAEPDSPLGRAEQVLEQAYQEPSPPRRIELARQALAICPDCANAYTLLAEAAASRKEALELYEKAVAAAERALGPEIFREAEGHFWGFLETRPYMRARQRLAETLWTSGLQEEAVVHAQDMLRLNPGDNQGIRYTLAAWLLNLDRDEELAQLLERYADEGSAAWAYTRVLLAFRRQGDTPETRDLLKEAKKINKHVPDYLLDNKPLPRQPPPYYSPGEPSEAIEYAAGFLVPWKNTAGALDWLREATNTRKRRAAASTFQEPAPRVLSRLKRLPQHGDTWMADGRQLPMYVEDRHGHPERPWIILVVSSGQQLILAQQISEEQPSPRLLWDTLAEAMQKPLMGDKQRPTELQIRANLGWEELRPTLQNLGVEMVMKNELKPIDNIVEHLAESIGGGAQPPALVDLPGVSVEQVGRFFDAAAEFYQQAPWRRLGYENAVRIECAEIETGPRFAVLMGQSGLTMGVAMYEELDLLKRLWAERLSDEENAELTVATTVTFGGANEIAVADLEAAQRHGWKVARPDAYPSIFHKDRGMSMRPPTAGELEFAEASLRALPEFIKRRRQDDFTPESITVTTGAGERTLKLMWERTE